MKMISIIMVDCLLFFVSMVAMAQIAQRDFAPLNPNNKMPLQNGTPGANRFRNDQKRPRPNADGPWNHKVLLATSRDGLSWTVNQQVLIEQASVPELFAGPDGKPIILFVDASGKLPPGVLGAIVQESDGSWKRGNTNLEGADPNVVKLDDGTYRAYTKAKDGTINVHTSKDGLNWCWLDAAFSDKRYPQSTDPDVFKTPSGWVMLISLGPRLLAMGSESIPQTIQHWQSAETIP